MEQLLLPVPRATNVASRVAQKQQIKNAAAELGRRAQQIAGSVADPELMATLLQQVNLATAIAIQLAPVTGVQIPVVEPERVTPAKLTKAKPSASKRRKLKKSRAQGSEAPTGKGEAAGPTPVASTQTSPEHPGVSSTVPSAPPVVGYNPPPINIHIQTGGVQAKRYVRAPEQSGWQVVTKGKARAPGKVKASTPTTRSPALLKKPEIVEALSKVDGLSKENAFAVFKAAKADKIIFNRDRLHDQLASIAKSVSYHVALREKKAGKKSTSKSQRDVEIENQEKLRVAEAVEPDVPKTVPGTFRPIPPKPSASRTASVRATPALSIASSSGTTTPLITDAKSTQNLAKAASIGGEVVETLRNCAQCPCRGQCGGICPSLPITSGPRAGRMRPEHEHVN